MLFKKSHPPSDYEMNCYRKNESWSEAKEKEEKIRIEKVSKVRTVTARKNIGFIALKNQKKS